MNNVSLWQIAQLVPRVLRGTHAGHPAVEMVRLDEIEISAGNGLFFQLDGELREARARTVRVRVEPRALRVLG